jgi:hypothetical protein
MFHRHHYVVTSTEEILAEGLYPMLYIDSKCNCGERKGRYTMFDSVE